MEPSTSVDTVQEPSASGKKLFLPKRILQLYGCQNCIWKTYGQCPEGFTLPHEKVKGGYCTEFGSFILSLGSKGDSTSAIMEKYLTYTQQVQAQADHNEFQESLKKLKEFESNKDIYLHEHTIDDYKKELIRLHQDVTFSKIWWSRLTDAVVKNLARIADRESRAKESQGKTNLNVSELNIILQESSKVLLEHEGGNK